MWCRETWSWYYTCKCEARWKIQKGWKACLPVFVVWYFLELLQLSRSQQSSFRSQDSYPVCSSPTCSLQSTDSLDQFCKDFESSFNLTSEKSLNVPTLQLCDNKGWSDLGDAEINKEQGFSIDDSLVLTTSTDNTDQGSLNVDTSPNYEGKFSQLQCLWWACALCMHEPKSYQNLL